MEEIALVLQVISSADLKPLKRDESACHPPNSAPERGQVIHPLLRPTRQELWPRQSLWGLTINQQQEQRPLKYVMETCPPGEGLRILLRGLAQADTESTVTLGRQQAEVT